MKNWLSFLLFPLLILLPALACGDSTSGEPQISTMTPSGASEAIVEPEPDTAVELANLGDLVEQGGYSLAVVTVEDPAPAGLLYTPTEGSKLVAVEAIIGNVSNERVSVNLLNATLVDMDGFTYQPELAGRDEQLATVDLALGQRVKGWVAFEIPAESEPDVFRYEASNFPSVALRSKLKTADGLLVADVTVPLSASGDVERDVLGNLGDLVELSGYSLTAEAVEDPTTPGILYSSSEGTKLVGVQIVVGNVSGDEISVNPLNATLVDTDGYVYMAELAGRDGQIETVDLGAGERARGWVAFQIPATSAPESVRYQMSLFPLVELQAGVSE